jgi:hypothetical protein
MMKRLMLCSAAILMAAGVGMAAPKQAAAKAKARSYVGYVTDSMCATKGMKAITNADCVKKCIDNGAKYVLYDTYSKKVYQLDPQSAVAEHGAHHVRISGTLDGDTIHVESVKMIMAPKKKAAPAKSSS